MGKDLKGKYIGKGYRQRADGRYEARTIVNGKSICLYDMDLEKLKKSFSKRLEEMNQVVNDYTFNDWFNSWFKECKAPQLKSDVVRNNYKSKMRNTYCSIIGNTLLTDITQIDIQRATNELSNRGYVKRTVSEAYSLLRECLEVAVLNNLIKNNPCVGIRIRCSNIYAERRVLTLPEQEKFLTYAKGTTYYEIYQFLLVTGLRIGELSALQWDDIDFERRCIYVKRSLSVSYFEGKKHQELTTPKSYSSYRTIPFFEDTENILLSWKDKQISFKKKMKNRWRLPTELGDLVFTTTVGSPVTRYVLAGQINKIVNAINLDELYNASKESREPIVFESLSPHAFRHTFATRCFEKNMNPQVVQKLMGHANYDTTLSYTHVYDELLITEVKKVGKFI